MEEMSDLVKYSAQDESSLEGQNEVGVPRIVIGDDDYVKDSDDEAEKKKTLTRRQHIAEDLRSQIPPGPSPGDYVMSIEEEARVMRESSTLLRIARDIHGNENVVRGG